MENKGKELDTGGGSLTPDERDAIKRRAAELGDRLAVVQARKTPQHVESRARGAGMGDAVKLAGELVVGVVVGVGFGWFLDRQFGTQPWLMVVFLMLGFIAGIINLIRTAQKMQAAAAVQDAAAAQAAAPDDRGRDGSG